MLTAFSCFPAFPVKTKQQGKTASQVVCIDYKAILELVLSHLGSVSKTHIDDLSASIADLLKVELTAADIRALGRLLGKLKVRWAVASCNKERLLSKYQDWADLIFCLSEPVYRPSSADSNKGRPSLPFPEMSHRSKLRATEDLRQEASSGALLFATASNNQKDGRRTSAQLVQAVASPHRGPAIERRLAKPEAFNTSYTPEEVWPSSWTLTSARTNI